MIMIISIIIAMIISKQGMYRTFKCVSCESCKMMCSYHYGTIELIRGHMIQSLTGPAIECCAAFSTIFVQIYPAANVCD